MNTNVLQIGIMSLAAFYVQHNSILVNNRSLFHEERRGWMRSSPVNLPEIMNNHCIIDI